MEKTDIGAAIEDKMSVLRSHYLVQLSEKVKAIEIMRHTSGENKISTDSLRSLQVLAHQMAGGGGIYGYPVVSETAGLLDHYLKNTAQPEASILFHMMEELCRVCHLAIDRDLRVPPSTDVAELSTAVTTNVPSLPLIAIIDDDPMIRLAYQVVFEGKARLVMGINTHDARRIMAEDAPALMLLDDIMPGGPTGLSFLESIKNDPVLSKIPVIMVTASNTKEAMLRGLAAGAVDYIMKPFAPQKLLEAVMGRLGQRENHIVLALNDQYLVKPLMDRLVALGCRVEEDRETPLSRALNSACHSIIVLDASCATCLDRADHCETNNHIRFVFLGEKVDLPLSLGQNDRLVLVRDSSVDNVVRQIGLVLAAIKKQCKESKLCDN